MTATYAAVAGIRTGAIAWILLAGCTVAPDEDRAATADTTPAAATGAADTAGVRAEIEAAVWAFHAADTARDANAVVALLWPEYTMLVDDRRVDYRDVADGSHDFMAGLDLFHTVWSDLDVIPLTRDLALASFTFRDSIVTSAGELIRNQGPTTLLWERRDGEWRMRFGDADHYAIPPD